jgi:ATP-dependent Lhr-like helicase
LVDTGERKRLELTVEVPVDDMARIGQPEPVHRSTLLFVNSRRLAERLAGALNEAAGGPLVRAHHGSLAREERLLVEEQLKAGTLQGLVATSSLELGIDMGAIDLVIEIEAPPSVAAATRREPRASASSSPSSVAISWPWWRWRTGRWTTSSRWFAGPPPSPPSRAVFEGVLDMLSGRYPSDEFAELRARLN